jgi:hypothetical protein
MLKGILAISGQSGLFKLVAESKNSIKVSSLEDISVFTNEGDVALSKVLKSIFEKENGGATINHKLPEKDLKSYFEQVLPEFDKDKVYISDIKKILMWYSILLEKELLVFPEETEEKSEDTENPTEKNKSSEQS